MMYELRVCATQYCNFDCFYCRPGGEGIHNERKDISCEEIITKIKKMVSLGFSSVRITGGEPFVRKDIIDLLKKIKEIRGIDEVSIVTNGSLLNNEIINELCFIGVRNITVSLDTINKEKFAKITKCECLNTVLRNIVSLKNKDINVRVNMVVSRDNIDDVEDVWNFCINNKIDLKLLDLNDNGSLNWNYNYLSLYDVLKKMHVTCDEKELYIKGRLGTPMKICRKNVSRLIIKDSSDGTTYVPLCKKCKNFPCQTGITSPILTHDGRIKLCNMAEIGENNIYNINEKKDFNRFSKDFSNFYFAKLWKYNVKE